MNHVRDADVVYTTTGFIGECNVNVLKTVSLCLNDGACTGSVNNACVFGCLLRFQSRVVLNFRQHRPFR